MPLEPADSRELRQAYEQAPTDFVEITPLSRGAQQAWMRSFAEQEVGDADLRRRLVEALEGDRPEARYNSLLRSDPDLPNRWRDCRLQHVAEAIQGWAIANDLSLKVFSTAPRRPTGDRSVAPTPEGLGGAEIRRHAHAAIDRMSLGELLRLWIPLGSAVES